MTDLRTLLDTSRTKLTAELLQQLVPYVPPDHVFVIFCNANFKLSLNLSDFPPKNCLRLVTADLRPDEWSWEIMRVRKEISV